MKMDNFDKLSAKRVIIYPKDIQLLTGKSERYARKLVAQVKKYYNKESHQPLSIKEFCQYMGLEFEEVKQVII